jgi:transcriptional regulator with XRE-family HTH domain
MDAFDKLVRYLDGPPKVTQAVFAKRVGAQQSVVSMWRRRERRPGARYIPRLNKLLGTTLGDWLKARLRDEQEAA